MRIRRFDLPDRRRWLRVGEPEWPDPLDATYAQQEGGRWNPPGSFPTLYLNADPRTARSQLDHLLDGTPVEVEDLDDDAFREAGLGGLDLPRTYPLVEDGSSVPHAVWRIIGDAVYAEGLRGVVARSAATPDGGGRELAWFPATSRSRAHPVWEEPLQLGAWRYATSWNDLDLPGQADLA